ncbi:MAG: hypothetical protein JWL76_279 [Thermoleophilia bacterium]|nr:hypothetical protein [Thermoleophilia bacterium]
MDAAEQLTADLAEDLGADVRAGKMFGRDAVMYRGKAIACFIPDGCTIPLDDPEHADALALSGAKLFDPSGKGRPMKAWVVLGPEHAGRVTEFARAAARRIDGLLDA